MVDRSTGATLERLCRSLIDHEDEFRNLDAAAGDGDLGITVRSAAAAILEWLAETGPAACCSELLAGIAQVCADTSPSTFGSLVSRGLNGAARAIGEGQVEGVSSLIVGLDAGIAMVKRRGRAELGDKTFLDALIPALEAARGAASVAEALPLMREAAIAGTEQLVSAVPKHGRAAWVGERARGVPDAGSVVVIRALEALEEAGLQPWDAGSTFG
jgi:dihydroxyacetone kinase-like protein